MTDLDALVGAVGVRRRRDRRHLTWIGESIVGLDDPRAVETLADVLYGNAYVLGAPTPLEPPLDPGVDPGWSSIRVDERMAATWGGWTATGRGTVEAPGMPAIRMAVGDSREPGSTVSIPLASISTDLLPGWCLLHHGDVYLGAGAVRLYANTRGDAARLLAGALTTELLDAGLDRFGAKFLLGRDHDDRTDSTVVYLPVVPDADLMDRLAALLGPAVAADATPMFTRRLLPGIALAHSPEGGASFGQLRCKQVSSALVAHLRAGRRTPLVVPFDTTRPWEGPASGLLDHVVPPAPPARGRTESAAPEHALHALADELARSVIAAGDRATWLTRDRGSGRWVAAGAAVYDGAAGPLAVLAHACRLDGGTRHLPLLRAAARGMLDRQDELPLDGFHSGQAGTAAALAEAADMVQDERLSEIAHQSLDRARRGRAASREWDLLGGTAGTILGISAAAGLLGVDAERDIEDWAGRLLVQGEDDPGSGGIRWRSRIGRRRPTLAGLAHGGSGAALALAVASSHERDFAGAVARSVDFEDICRSSAHGWMDHRNPAATRAAVAWCHGAGGIGLASAALDVRRPGTFRARTQAAAERLAASLSGPDHDRGLCHGRSGRALALAVVADHLGDHTLAEKARMDLDAMGRPAGSLDLGLMNGEPGVVLARLAGAGLARPSIAFVVDLRLLNPETCISQ